MFIVSQLMTNKEKERLRKIFIALDKDGDGTLTQEELIEGYTKLYGNKERAMVEVNCLMSTADMDGNGVIDYSEFIFAAANKSKLASKTNIKQAFDLFDIVIILCNAIIFIRIKVGLFQLKKLKWCLELEGNSQKMFGMK